MMTSGAMNTGVPDLDFRKPSSGQCLQIYTLDFKLALEHIDAFNCCIQIQSLLYSFKPLRDMDKTYIQA